MDTSDILVSVDSPRLLRSVTKKLQQQASGMCSYYKVMIEKKFFLLAKKQLAYGEETIASDQSVIRT
jgi:hypothetical protein